VSRELKDLRMAIKKDDKLSGNLDTYMQLKTCDLEKSKLLSKITHSNKITNIYQVEMANFQRLSSKSLDILQEKFLVLRSLNEIDNKMLENLESLEKLLMGHRSVKFAEANPSIAEESSENIINLSVLEVFSDESCDNPVLTKKRTIENDDDFDEMDSKKSRNSPPGFKFLLPKAIDFDKGSQSKPTASSIKSIDMNVTFNLTEANNSGPSPKENDKNLQKKPSASTFKRKNN
jgi:hypothetical protein